MEKNKDLKLGFKKIDEQHTKLIEIGKKIKPTMPNEEISKILDELIEYSRVHFSTEEKYFEEFDYPDGKEHEMKHASIIKKLLEFKDAFDNNQKLGKEFFNFIHDWIYIHLDQVDRKYVNHFKEHGLK